MTRDKKPYSPSQLISALLMMLALIWLTVSIPFVYNSQQQLAKQNQTASPANVALAEEECGSGLGNTTEEKKSSNGSSLTEEYLHHLHIDDLFISQISQSHNSENAGVYNAFHGEVQVPPPNVA
jgi:hypothetical protein